MILVRKNVYKVFDLLKMFSSLKDVFESVGVCFENSKDVWFENEQATRNNLPTQSISSFLPSFDIDILPLIW